MAAEVRDGRITAIRDNPLRPPSMRGCLRGYKAHHLVTSPGRLTKPLIRTGERGSGRFKEAGWDEALDLVAERLGNIIETSGSGAILHVGGSGSCRGAVHHTGRLSARFFNVLGGYSGTDGNYSSRAMTYTLPFIFGTGDAGQDAGTLRRSRFILLWGANISDTRFGCELEGVVRENRKRGVPVVVVDPRRSRTVEKLATEWIAPFPGTDSALMAAVLSVILNENLADKNFIARTCFGFDRLEEYLAGGLDGVLRDPEWAEPITGVPAGTIADLARRYAAARPAALVPGLSIQRVLGGEEAVRFGTALQAATGNIGVTGGSSGGRGWGGLAGPRCGKIDTFDGPNTVRFPVYQWPDVVLGSFPRSAPGPGVPVRALYSVGGNYLVQGSDIGKNKRAFSHVDFTVCHDLFLTDTAAYADVVLPATSFLEREDIVFPDGNYLFYSRRCVDPVGESRRDYDIFADLAARVGRGRDFTGGRSCEEWLETILRDSEIESIETFRDTGIYDGKDHMRTAFADFVKDPKKNPLPTPSGKIEIYSEAFAGTGFSPTPEVRVPGEPTPAEVYPLRLITPHARCRVNSQNFNQEWSRSREEQRLWLHPDDARDRSIENGAEVEVKNRSGSLICPVRVTDAVRPGVVSLLQGGWGELSPNHLTSTKPTLPSSGSRTHSVRVQVSKKVN